MIDHHLLPQANFEMAVWLAAVLVVLVMALWAIYQALRALSRVGSPHSRRTMKRTASLFKTKAPR
jgi:hypothetical protein